ncbi:MAG: hypothetical protein MZW92_62090 [Comamonadaceae bacterium]|nr:hypothetical protein [Comamonadaceae bacterium]
MQKMVRRRGRRRDDPGHQEGPDLRHRRHGRHGRHRRRDLPATGRIGFPPLNERLARRMLDELADEAAPRRATAAGPRPPSTGSSRRWSACPTWPPTSRRSPSSTSTPCSSRPTASLALDARIVGDRERRRGPAAALRAPVPAALPRGVRPAGHAAGRHGAHPPPDQARGRAAVAGPPRQLLAASRSTRGSATSSSGSPTRWPAATATSTTTGSWPSSPRPATGAGPPARRRRPPRRRARAGRRPSTPCSSRTPGRTRAWAASSPTIALGIARQWGIRTLTAITTTDNPRMIAVFEKRGFRIVNDLETSLVEVSKDLL